MISFTAMIVSNTFGEDLSDDSNKDSDESTDKYIGFNWADMFGNWAGGIDPQTLANIKFELLDDVDLTSLKHQ